MLKQIALTDSPFFEGLSATRGGEVRGLQIVPTAALSDSELVGADAQSLALNAGTITTQGSSEALIDMDGSTISPFQVNARAARSERFAAASLLRSSGAARITGISYGS